jgi:hypothetical protein
MLILLGPLAFIILCAVVLALVLRRRKKAGTLTMEEAMKYRMLSKVLVICIRSYGWLVLILLLVLGMMKYTKT